MEAEVERVDERKDGEDGKIDRRKLEGGRAERPKARRQIVCGLHVHVGVGSREEGVAVLDRLRVWLPALLALSGNSPFWYGRESGFSSYRYQAWVRWPTSGPTEVFGSVEEATRAIPVIDFGPAFRGEPSGLDAAAALDGVQRCPERSGLVQSRRDPALVVVGHRERRDPGARGVHVEQPDHGEGPEQGDRVTAPAPCTIRRRERIGPPCASPATGRPTAPRAFINRPKPIR